MISSQLFNMKNLFQKKSNMDPNASKNPRHDGLNWLNMPNWGLCVIYLPGQGSCPVELGIRQTTPPLSFEIDEGSQGLPKLPLQNMYVYMGRDGVCVCVYIYIYIITYVYYTRQLIEQCH